jgi:RNA polymerase sigma-70 factor (ECF subfamily)
VGPALRLFARARGLRDDQADEVVQESFVRLLDQERWPECPRAWLFVTARNLMTTGQRGWRTWLAKRGLFAAARAPHVQTGPGSWFEPDPRSLMDPDRTEAALAALTAEEREAVVLRVWGGLTLEQVGAVTGRSTAGAFRLYRGALEKMRARLEERHAGVRGVEQSA